MRVSRWASRFDRADQGGDPMAAMATLVDVMLVFACGLMAAIALSQGRPSPSSGGKEVERARDLPRVPEGASSVGGGYRAVGRVFRDPKTGKLILVESPEANEAGP